MPKVSVNILTKDRPDFLQKALGSVAMQTFKDLEVVIVDDGSKQSIDAVLDTFGNLKIKKIHHQSSLGITLSRQDALAASNGVYVAILDDDDEWVDKDKLKKQVEFLDSHKDYILVGGGMQVFSEGKSQGAKFRPEDNESILKTMLFRNNFFTSSVMFRKDVAQAVGGFIRDEIDLAEDYDLWLRMGPLGKLYNFQEVFVNYRQSSYNTDKFKQFLEKQLRLVRREKDRYPGAFIYQLILKFRLKF